MSLPGVCWACLAWHALAHRGIISDRFFRYHIANSSSDLGLQVISVSYKNTTHAGVRVHPNRDIGSSGTEATDHCVLPNAGSGNRLMSYEEQQVLLTTGPFSPSHFYCWGSL